jgi:hypothetical protein
MEMTGEIPQAQDSPTEVLLLVVVAEQGQQEVME